MVSIIKEEELLGNVTVKIKLKRIDTQKEIIVKILLDSRTIRLIISLEFIKKQKFKLKKNKKTYLYIGYK